jgi:hypothetical protein
MRKQNLDGRVGASRRGSSRGEEERGGWPSARLGTLFWSLLETLGHGWSVHGSDTSTLASLCPWNPAVDIEWVILDRGRRPDGEVRPI